ncbi:RimJ/RimL family protein N-acetyltransferase [Kineococcus xinjiangensis]|uniref:RimJ/RimL family protein N-acetyltransferase n=1 Tax=Kineococcus xinjiangensis TaxID=512762 RepID=A0A2S6IGQ7_9ACTN|nr:GNAT family N-acetyltransferase [Kineococcus xinjiangensis]PPK93398.1 RimJ/RimL family protein N-acetyltransferase [Kineococcus xinjiangensis]
MGRPHALRAPAPPRLTDGQDLLLRPHTAADLDALVAQCQDPEEQRWTRVAVPFGAAEAEEHLARAEQGWADGTLVSFAVEHDGRYVGRVHLRPDDSGWAELGFATSAGFRGRGLTVRAVRAALGWGFDELGLEGVHWRARLGNWASRRVAWACGFRVEGVLRGGCVLRDGRHDAWVGSLRREDPREPASPWFDVPVLDGDGVRLRPWRADDAERVVEACDDPRTRRWLPHLPAPYTRAHAEWYLDFQQEEAAAGGGVYWCVADGDDRCVASVSVMIAGRGAGAGAAELGWWTHPAARGRGVMTRAARLAAGHALASREAGGLGLHRLLVRVAEGNAASQAVAVRLGAREVGRDREAELLRDGSRQDLLRYDLLREELDGG